MRCVFLKKYKDLKHRVPIIVVSISMVVFLAYFIGINVFQACSKIEYVYDNNIDVIKFNDVKYEYLGCEAPKPYHFINDDSWSNFSFVPSDSLLDYLFMWDRVGYYSEEYDEAHNFIIYCTWGGRQDIYVKQNFVYPTLQNNNVDEVRMSLVDESKGIINDKEIVDEIIKCAKSNGEIELEEKTADYIKKHSDDSYFFLMYEGYPLAQVFHLSESENGKYTIDNYGTQSYCTVWH